MGLLGWIIAEETGGGMGVDVDTLLRQMPILVVGAIIGFLFIRNTVVSGRTHRALEVREEEQRDENSRLRTALEEKVVPALVRAGSLTEQTIAALDATAGTLTEMSAILERALRTVPLLEDGAQSVEDFRGQLEELAVLIEQFEHGNHEDVVEHMQNVQSVLERVVRALQNWE
jgi:hypothetical protein